MTNILLRTLLIVGLIGTFNTVRGQATPEGAPTPVTPDASREAKALVRLLHEISGRYTLTGQHNYPNTKDTYTLRTAQLCGKTPAVFGQDFGFAAPGNQDAAAARPDIIAEIKRQHEKGSIITLCWHAVRPTDDEPVNFRGSVEGKLTDQLDWVHHQFKKFGRPSAETTDALQILKGIEEGFRSMGLRFVRNGSTTKEQIWSSLSGKSASNTARATCRFSWGALPGSAT